MLVDQALAYQISASESCHKLGVPFITVGTFGAFGYMFSDFGEKFRTKKLNEERISAIPIVSIKNVHKITF